MYRLVNMQGCWYVVDSSRYGTFVNGIQALKGHRTPLRPGDHLQLGPAEKDGQPFFPFECVFAVAPAVVRYPAQNSAATQHRAQFSGFGNALQPIGWLHRRPLGR
jgi:hypothetical protein